MIASGPAGCVLPRRPDGLTVTVAICTYTKNRYAIMRRAADAVARQLGPDDELILVVDHAADLLALAREQLTGARVVENVNSRGASGSRNTAIELARGDALVFLDDDAVPRPGWLEALLAPYADEDVIGVGGQLEPVWPDGPPAWFPTEFLWVVGCSYTGLPSAADAIRNPIGANMSVRRDVVARVGGFDETLGRVGKRAVGCEETLFGLQATRLTPHARFVYQPDAIADHQVTRERARFGYFGRRCWLEGTSKARLSRLHDRPGALSTERRYVVGTLTIGIARQLSAALRGDRAGPLRALAMLAGLALTSVGYVTHLYSRADAS